MKGVGKQKDTYTHTHTQESYCVSLSLIQGGLSQKRKK